MKEFDTLFVSVLSFRSKGLLIAGSDRELKLFEAYGFSLKEKY